MQLQSKSSWSQPKLIKLNFKGKTKARMTNQRHAKEQLLPNACTAAVECDAEICVDVYTGRSASHILTLLKFCSTSLPYASFLKLQRRLEQLIGPKLKYPIGPPVNHLILVTTAKRGSWRVPRRRYAGLERLLWWQWLMCRLLFPG